MLNPDVTVSWLAATPVVMIAIIVLFLPGLVGARLVGVSWLTALTLSPGLSTSTVILTGVAAPMVGLRWGPFSLCLGIAMLWLGAFILGRRLRHRAPVEPRWNSSLAVGIAVLIAAVGVATVLMPVAGSPQAFPQHPDTIFHLGDAQWMLEHGDISVLHASGFSSPTSGFYPAAFHGMVVTIAQLSGASVVVSTSAFVLVIAGLAWPLGCILLARTILGPSKAVVIAVGVTSVAFSAYPFMLMGFGVLWPNLFGQTLLPSALALLAISLGVTRVERVPIVGRSRALWLLLATVPGLALAHPNAFVTLLVFGYLMIAGWLINKAWRVRISSHRHAMVILIIWLTITLVGAIAMTAIAPGSMKATGKPGPELGRHEAITDTLLFAPRGAALLWILAVFVLIGVGVVLIRRVGPKWLVAALVLMMAMFYLNVAVDTSAARLLTWPWYNNAVRLAAVGVLPAALLAAAGLAAAAQLLKASLGRLHLTDAGAGLITALAFLIATGGAYTTAHRAVIWPFFHPVPSHSWASPTELESLHYLAQYIPKDAKVAANPWDGGTYLYIVSGRHLLLPTEKSVVPGDRALLAAHLAQAGRSPQVCAAAKRQHVRYAITGGRPFAWGAATARNDFHGIDRVGSSSAFRLVATKAPYKLYEMTRCATS